MKGILLRIVDRAGDLSDVQPIFALFLGGALFAVFWSALLRAQPASESGGKPGLLWTLYHQGRRLIWALLLVGIMVATLMTMRTYLHRTVADFQRSHGRITDANYNAVQTIWGAEQVQGELGMELYYHEEITERIESEDITKPAVLRKRIVRQNVPANPFVSARHDVTLRQNPRRKGSALYGGYETTSRFNWRLKNPTDRELQSLLSFPLPADGAMYDNMAATLNGEDILPQMQLRDAALVLNRDLQPNEMLDLSLSFSSRGMSYWYFQVREPREIRDFTLTLDLPDLAKARLNYPEGCMTPTAIQAGTNGNGCVLTYRLDHAISRKGMGISLPSLPQPGATTNAVLTEIERGWLLVVAMLALGTVLAPMPQWNSNRSAAGVLMAVFFSVATACVYGLLADFSDLLFGFWGTAGLVLLPMFVSLAWFLTRVVPGRSGQWLGGLLLLFGIVYPCLAGLDAGRQSLYFNICALIFLSWAAGELLGAFKRQSNPTQETAARLPVD